MTFYTDSTHKNTLGTYTWFVRLSVNGQPGYGGFTCLMNSLPVLGQTLEFYGTPEGDFMGEVVHIHQAATFLILPPAEGTPTDDFGMTASHKICTATRQEWQITVEVTHSSELQEFGVTAL